MSGGVVRSRVEDWICLGDVRFAAGVGEERSLVSKVGREGPFVIVSLQVTSETGGAAEFAGEAKFVLGSGHELLSLVSPANSRSRSSSLAGERRGEEGRSTMGAWCGRWVVEVGASRFSCMERIIQESQK